MAHPDFREKTASGMIYVTYLTTERTMAQGIASNTCARLASGRQVALSA